MNQVSKRRLWKLSLAAALAAALMVPAAAWAADGDLAAGSTVSTTVKAQATAQTYDTSHTSPTPKRSGQIVGDGSYAIISASDTTTLKQVVGVKKNSKANNASAMLQAQKANKAQKWTITYSRKSGAYVIVNARSKKVLSVKSAKNGGNVVQTKSKNVKKATTINVSKFPKKQLWKFVATKTGYKIVSRAKSSLVLNVDGNNINVAKSNNSEEQRFWLGSTTKWKKNNLLQNGYYTLRPQSETNVLGLAKSQFVNGTKFTLAEDKANLDQAFEIAHISGSTYKITVVSTGKALTVSGSDVVQKTYSGANTQKWTAQAAADGSGVVFTSKGKQLGYNGTNAVAGSNACAWAVSPTTTRRTNLQLRALAKANQYGGKSTLCEEDDCYYYIALDMSGHQIVLFARDDTDQEWEIEDQWRCSTMGHGTIQFRAVKKHPNIRTTGTVRETNPDPYGHGYSAYYWTHIGYGSWFHSTLYSPGSHRSSDGRLGYSISNGCIRNPIDKAKWLYTHLAHIPTGISIYL